MRGRGTPMRGSANTGGRARRWGARAAAGDDIDYGGALSYSAGRTGSSAPAATKSPPYPPRHEEPQASDPGGMTWRRDDPYPDEDGARAVYAEMREELYEPGAALAGGPGAFGAQRRRAEESVRFTLNALAIGLVIFILAIPIAVGLSKVGIVLPSGPQQASSGFVPTPPVAQGFVGFQSASFSLAYPSTWSRTPGDGHFPSGAALSIESFSNGGQQEVVVITTGVIAADQVQSHFGDALASAGATSAHQIASGLSLTYDGAAWSGADYAATLITNGQHAAIQARVLWATSGATTYFIVLVAPPAGFTQVDTQTFEPILQSFRFQ
jgi:hypothetical protein